MLIAHCVFVQTVNVGNKTITMLDEQGGNSVFSMHLIPDVYFNISKLRGLFTL